MKYSSFYKGKNSINFMKRRGLNLVNKKAQLTVFIILGIILVAGILVFFFYVKPDFFKTSTELSVDTCIKDAVNSEIENLVLTAGVINPQFNYMYQDENITFVCYTDEYYKPCVVQVPFLQSNFEQSLNRKTSEKIKQCYRDATAELRAEGYEVISGQIQSNVIIQPKSILVRVSSPITVSSQGSSQSFEKYDVEMPSDLFDLLSIADSVLQFESTYGDSNTLSYMAYYPDFIVDKIRRDDGIKIYVIDNKKDLKFKFATRSYVWPPGYGI